jgi:DME family drug/metabolite transporter
LGIAIAFLQAFCWAGTSIILRSLTTRMNPLLINGLRAASGWLFLIPAALLLGSPADWALLTPLRMVYLISSVVLGAAVGDLLYLRSLKILGVGRAFPITSSSPVFTALFSAVILGDKITLLTLVGMAIVLFGVYLVARPRRDIIAIDNTPPIEPRQALIGIASALATAVIWAGATVVLAMGLTDGINTIVANSVRVPAVIAVSLLAAGQQHQLGAIRRLNWRTVGMVAATGLLGWAIGGTLYTTAVQMIGPGKTALINSTAPIFAVPMSYFFLKERPTRYTLIGTIITVVGITLVI